MIKKILATVLMSMVGMLCTHAQDVENIAKAKPFEIHGSLSAMGGYYSSQNMGSTNKPYRYTLMAAPTISIYGIQIPLNFTLTEGSKSVTNPFAQFGINPYWKWIHLYGGWTNMSWSPTTLNGKTFLGVGVELNSPYIIRLGAMYGRLNPAIKQDSVTFGASDPQYKRKGYAFKFGLGKDSNYVDFIYLKAKDEMNSIPMPSKDLQNFTAEENAIIGIKNFQAFFKKKLVWQADAAISAYTRDQNSQLLDIGDGIGTGLLNMIIQPRLSTSYSWSVHTSLGYKAKNFALGADYSRIMPEYRSMGVDYLLNDQEKVSLLQNFNIAKNKVILGLSEFFQHDDLNNRKAVKTDRVGGNLTLALNLSAKFGASLTYSNFLLFQQAGYKPLNDSTKLSQVQQTISLSPHYTMINTKMVQNYYAVVTYQRLDDRNSFTAKYYNNSTINVNIGYLASVLKNATTYTPSFNVLSSTTQLFRLLTIGPSMGVSKGFYDNKLTVGGTLGYVATNQNKQWVGNSISNTLSASYTLKEHHTFKFSNSILYNHFNTGNTSEYKGDVTYIFTF